MTTLKLPRGYEPERVLKERDGVRVIVARSEGSNRAPVVLKVVGPEAPERTRNLFLDDVRLRSEIDHPGISPVLDHGRLPGGLLFAVSPYIQTDDPARWVEREPKTRAALLAERLSEPIAYLHERGLIHGDIKPGNILFRSDRRGIRELRLTDFLPRTFRRESAFGVLTGTPAYLAPEVFRGEDPDHRSDLYSLGATLFEFFAGRPLFSGSAVDLAMAHIHAPPRQRLPSRSRIPAAVWDAVARLLEKEPADRVASVADFLQETRGRRARKPPLVHSGVQPFVPRPELERTVRAWLDQDRRPCLVLAGPMGSGRTRFLRRFAGDLRMEGRPVLALAPEVLCPAPFDGARALFRALSAESLPLGSRGKDAESGEDVARILSTSKEEIRLFRRLRDAWGVRLARFAADSADPAVILIDDADRLDDASSRFLSFVIARGLGIAARYVLAREDGVGAGAGRLFAELEAGGSARVEPVAPLGREEIAVWVRGSFGGARPAPDLLETTARLSGGNPLRLEALLRGWAERHRIREQRGVLRLHGRPAEGLVLLRSPGALPTKGLPPAALELAGAVALVSRPRGARFFERLLSIPPHEFPGLAALLAERRIVRREGRAEGDVYAPFLEELRAPLSGLLSPGRRKALLRAAARIAESEGGDGDAAALAEAAEHWERAGFPGPASRALLHASTALEKVSLPREAADLARNALRMKDGIRSPLERGKALQRVASLRLRAGEPRAALAALRLLRRVLGGEAGGEELVRSAVRSTAWIRYFRGSPGHAERLLSEALAAGGLSGPKEEAAVRCDLGWFALSAGRPGEARDQLRHALELLRGSKAAALKGRAENRLGAAAFYESAWGEAIAHYERAVRILERTGSPELVGALSNLALVRLWNGRLSEARLLLEKARASARAGGEALEEARIAEDLSRVLFRLGDVDEAARVLEEASAVHEDFGDEGGLARVALSRGQMARERGLLDQSLEALQKGLALARSQSNPYGVFDGLNLLALTHIARGEPDPARAALEEASAVLGDRLVGRYEALLLRSRARLASLLGDRDEAGRLFDRAEAGFREGGERLMEAETVLLAVRARMDLMPGAVDDPALRRAEGRLAGTESPWITLRFQLLLGRREEARGDAAAAGERFREAVRIARALHARVDLAEALARLGALHARLGEKRRGRALIEEASSLDGLVRAAVPSPLIEEARALLQGEVEEEGEGFRSLCRIAGIINSLRDSGAILDHVLDQALDHLRAERGLVLVRGARGDLLPRSARSIEGAELRDVTRFSATLLRKAEESEEPLVADNVLADPRFEGAESVSAYNILSVACAPLRSRGRPLGLVYVDNCRSPNVFSRRDITFLQALADLAGVALENAALLEDLQRENALLREEFDRRAEVPEFTAESPAMQATLGQLQAAAKSEINVLLLGDTGSGKGLAAHWIHRESPRRDRPFLRLNCSAMVPTLVEDALFGHEAGAFTDARERKAGIFERAHEGTLLLDEIGDMPLAAQAKLLRVLQDGEFERLGGTETLHANVRILAATNQNLAELVGRGGFRSDLYWRLNGVAIEIPPLRGRREDIPALARAFLSVHARRNRKDVRTISGAAESLLRSYDWPGNVRELDHVIERAVVFCDGRRIEPAHLTEEVRGAFPDTAHAGTGEEEGGRHLPQEIRGMESEILRQTLILTGWNRSKAARLLGIHESTVRKKIRLFRLDNPDPRKTPAKRNSYVRTKR